MTVPTRVDAVELAAALRGFLPTQRWFAGTERPAQVTVREQEILRDDDLEWLWALVDADGVTYQLVAGLDDENRAVLDDQLDADHALALLGVVTGGAHRAERVRPMGVEQSNTSLVFDDRLVLKLFRRVAEGPNPDVEVTSALAGTGFAHVAEPVATWRRGGRDLAIVQHYLPAAAEGWALALASARELFAARVPASEAGGDFAGESFRIGEVTAALHLALVRAFGADRGSTSTWANGLAERIRAGCGDRADEFVGQLAHVTDTGALVRVHGDYHLGQLVRTDAGWFVLDFEGEPSRPVEERRRPASPLKDVSGMLRSFHYAAEVARAEHEPAERHALESLAHEWVERNRQAFLDGYLATAGVSELLPSDPVSMALSLRAFELDKAVYELEYERAHRPDWAAIPEHAITRLLAG